MTRNIQCVASRRRARLRRLHGGCHPARRRRRGDVEASASQVGLHRRSLAIGSDGKLWAGSAAATLRRTSRGWRGRPTAAALGGIPTSAGHGRSGTSSRTAPTLYAVGPSQTQRGRRREPDPRQQRRRHDVAKNVTGSASTRRDRDERRGDAVRRRRHDRHEHRRRGDLVRPQHAQSAHRAVDMVGPTEAWASAVGTGDARRCWAVLGCPRRRSSTPRTAPAGSRPSVRRRGLQRSGLRRPGPRVGRRLGRRLVAAHRGRRDSPGRSGTKAAPRRWRTRRPGRAAWAYG